MSKAACCFFLHASAELSQFFGNRFEATVLMTNYYYQTVQSLVLLRLPYKGQSLKEFDLHLKVSARWNWTWSSATCSQSTTRTSLWRSTCILTSSGQTRGSTGRPATRRRAGCSSAQNFSSKDSPSSRAKAFWPSLYPSIRCNALAPPSGISGHDTGANNYVRYHGAL